MKSFDYRGLKCPIPVLKAFKIVKSLKKDGNQILEFLCDDPSAPKDFRDFCSNVGIKFLSSENKDNYIIIKIIV